eukprot:COSAG05_NODE_11774_length_497_cov_0.793970_1_plen_87_part_10
MGVHAPGQVAASQAIGSANHICVSADGGPLVAAAAVAAQTVGKSSKRRIHDGGLLFYAQLARSMIRSTRPGQPFDLHGCEGLGKHPL